VPLLKSNAKLAVSKNKAGFLFAVVAEPGILTAANRLLNIIKN
jgi:hypothetical protein